MAIFEIARLTCILQNAVVEDMADFGLPQMRFFIAESAKPSFMNIELHSKTFVYPEVDMRLGNECFSKCDDSVFCWFDSMTHLSCFGVGMDVAAACAKMDF